MAHFPDGDPLPRLSLRTMGLSEFNKLHEGVTYSEVESDYEQIGRTVFPESQEQKFDRIRRNLQSIKEAAVLEEGTSLKLRLFVTHNFFVEKIAMEIEPERTPDGGKFCCITSFKVTKGINGAASKVSLFLAENDDHVQSKS